MTPTEEQRLLAAVRAGEEAAFRALYRQHTPRLFAVVLRLLVRQADAEDAVQEAWLRAVHGLAGFRRESSFSTWLTGIGIRCALEILRRRSPPAEVTEQVEAMSTSTPHTTIDLERAIASLPDGYRAVLLLHDVEGYSHHEIARMLDIAVGTSKSQLFDARRAMRRLLAPTHEGVSR